MAKLWELSGFLGRQEQPLLVRLQLHERRGDVRAHQGVRLSLGATFPEKIKKRINYFSDFLKPVFGKLLQRPYGPERGEGAGERLRLVRREDGGGRQELGE